MQCHAGAHLGDAQDIRIHCSIRDQAVDGDWALLPEPMAAVLGLPKTSTTNDISRLPSTSLAEAAYAATVMGTCLSVCGLKSQSWMRTVSAPTRFRPWPPARVDSRNAKMLLSWLYLHVSRACYNVHKLTTLVSCRHRCSLAISETGVFA